MSLLKVSLFSSNAHNFFIFFLCVGTPSFFRDLLMTPELSRLLSFSAVRSFRESGK